MMDLLLYNETLQILVLSLVPGLPLIVAFLLAVPWLVGLGQRLVPWSGLPALPAALFLEPQINLEVAWFFMGGRMGLDPVGRHFLLLAALVWSGAAFFAQSYLDKDVRQRHFFFFYLLSMSFNFGLILAQDMLGFYLFFGLMSVSAYGLIIHGRTSQAMRAGRVYICLVMLGEVLISSGMILLAAQLPDLELATIAGSRPSNLSLLLLFIGFGIKAGALPLHVWLPLAHPVAPAPASAVLSGVMIKAGLLGWLRFLPQAQDVALPDWGALFVVLGFLAALYGVVIGLAQYDGKTVLAYSSISQMGVMTATLGCGLLAPQYWPQVLSALSLYVLHHGLAKSTLFLGTAVARLWQRAQRPLWFIVLMALPCLALAGWPLTSGALAKQAVKEACHHLPPGWGLLFTVMLPASACATTVLVGHFLKCLLMDEAGSGQSLPRGMLGSWLLFLLATLVLLAFWPTSAGLWRTVVQGYALWQGAWPVAAGAGLYLLWWRFIGRRQRWQLPAGDILAALPCWPTGARSRQRQETESVMKAPGHDPGVGAALVAVLGRGRLLEKRLMRWGVVGVAYLSIALLLFLGLSR